MTDAYSRVPAVSQSHVLLFSANCDRNRSTVCQTQSVFLLARYLISLRFQACLYERHILVVGVWFILERQVALVFITKRSKSRLTARSGTRKHALSSFRAVERHEKDADRRSKLVKPRKEPWKLKRKLFND